MLNCATTLEQTVKRPVVKHKMKKNSDVLQQSETV